MLEPLLSALGFSRASAAATGNDKPQQQHGEEDNTADAMQRDTVDDSVTMGTAEAAMQETLVETTQDIVAAETQVDTQRPAAEDAGSTGVSLCVCSFVSCILLYTFLFLFERCKHYFGKPSTGP